MRLGWSIHSLKMSSKFLLRWRGSLRQLVEGFKQSSVVIVADEIPEVVIRISTIDLLKHQINNNSSIIIYSQWRHHLQIQWMLISPKTSRTRCRHNNLSSQWSNRAATRGRGRGWWYKRWILMRVVWVSGCLRVSKWWSNRDSRMIFRIKVVIWLI